MATVTYQQIDGGPTYFADNGFTYAVGMGWDDPNFFSIGIWGGGIDSEAAGARLNDLGVNTLVVIGPSYMDAGHFDRIDRYNISLIADEDERNSPYLSDTAHFWVGNLSADEQNTFAEAFGNYASTVPNAEQDNRFWYENNNWYFLRPVSDGGGLAPYEAREALAHNVATPNGTLRHIDISGTDTYWFAGAHANVSWVKGAAAEVPYNGIIDDMGRDATQDETARGSLYGDAVDMFRRLQVDYPAPIAQFVETGGPYVENTSGSTYITPYEINWAVWSSLIHGAGQIIYFNHSFAGPGFSYDNLASPYFQTIQPGQTISIYDQVKATDHMVEDLAPVLNSPFALNYATVAGPHYEFGSFAQPLSGLEIMTKYYNETYYIFSDTRMSETQHNIPAQYTINDPSAVSVTVLYENRTIPIVNGSFSDTFADAWTVHIYQVNDTGEPPPPVAGSVSINDVSISEGNSGTKVATFTVTRSGGTEAFAVAFATADGTATVANSDYVATSGVLNFGLNENTKTFSVTINGDTNVETNEIFNVALSNPTNGATISDGQGVGTITNDDVPAGTNLVVNGGFETGSFSNWTLSGASGEVFIAPTQYAGPVHSGTYAAGFGSFAPTNGVITQTIATQVGQHYTLTFWASPDSGGSAPNNHFAATWDGQVLFDSVNAPNSGYGIHTFDVVGDGSSVLSFAGYNTPHAWFLDDIALTSVGDPPPVAGSVAIGDVTISEGNSGTKVATFTVTRAGGTAAFAVGFATANGTATIADNDYLATSGVLSFGLNENTKTVSVTINGDTKVEANETFSVVLSNPTNGATISDSQGVGTITNDDVPDTTPPPAPIISGFADDTAPIGDHITTDHTLTLSGTAEASSTVTLYEDDVSMGTTVATTGGAWSFATGTLADDTFHFSAKATDAAGNTSVESVVFDITVQTPPPVDQTINGNNSNNTLTGGAGNDTINGNGGNDTINGLAGNDTIHGGAGKDTINGGAGTDTLWGDAGNDTFVFRAGESNGDVLMDFAGGGNKAGDSIDFLGYGAGTVQQIDTTHWQVNSADGLTHDVLQLANGALLHPTDFHFM